MKKPSFNYRFLRGLVNFLVSTVVKVKVTGYDNFDKNRQYVIVCNHTSWLDMLLVIAKLPKTFQVVLLAEQTSAYQKKLIKFAIEKGELNIIGIDRASQQSRMKGLLGILKKAKEGYPVVIFPEGRINPDDSTLYPFYTGIFFTAVQTGLPILPVYLRGASRLYFRRRINVNFGTPIEVKKGDNAIELAKKTYKHLLNNVQPPAPINKRKNIKMDFTRAFLGDAELPPPANVGEMIADVKASKKIFMEANESTKNKFMKKDK